jgi:hypothetical protein
MTATPASARERACLRGRVIVRMGPGEAPPAVPSLHDVRRRAQAAATSLGLDTVDRALRRHSDSVRVTRSFAAARNVGVPGKAHVGFDDLEEELGLSRTFRIDLDEDTEIDDLVDRLRHLGAVEMASPVYLCETPFASVRRRAPADPQRLRRLIGADRAMAMEPGDVAVLIGLVDSGVSLAHPELVDCLRPGLDTVDLRSNDMPRGLALVGPPSRDHRHPQDEQGHGTACASIMAASGLSMPAGLAGASDIVPVKALAAVRQPDHKGITAVGALPDIDHAVKMAVDLGARVLNLSFGTPASALGPDDPIPHVEVVRYALARDCVLVAASGNSGDFTAYFPAKLPGVIAVGSVDADGMPSDFVCRGSHLALTAPGEGIPVAAIDGYTEGYGTSFAAPFVTAAAALMVARGLRHSTPLSAATIRRLLVRSARAFPPAADRRGLGAGILDVPAALDDVDSFCTSDSEEELDGDLAPDGADADPDLSLPTQTPPKPATQALS